MIRDERSHWWLSKTSVLVGRFSEESNLFERAVGFEELMRNHGERWTVTQFEALWFKFESLEVDKSGCTEISKQKAFRRNGVLSRTVRLIEKFPKPIVIGEILISSSKNQANASIGGGGSSWLSFNAVR